MSVCVFVRVHNTATSDYRRLDLPAFRCSCQTELSERQVNRAFPRLHLADGGGACAAVGGRGLGGLQLTGVTAGHAPDDGVVGVVQDGQLDGHPPPEAGNTTHWGQ